MQHRIALGALVALAALATAAAASAHAIVSPAVALDKKLQLFTLSVPTEKSNLFTTEIELTLPKGFAIDSYAPSTWKRTVHGSTITWSGGRVPTEEDAVFSFNASTSGAKTYTFDVRQTYSDGSVVDWNGPESSDNPAPTVDARASIGGGGGTSTLTVVALVLAGAALLVVLASLLARSGRPLT
jgi:uncharacterized protein YcnI